MITDECKNNKITFISIEYYVTGTGLCNVLRTKIKIYFLKVPNLINKRKY